MLYKDRELVTVKNNEEYATWLKNEKPKLNFPLVINHILTAGLDGMKRTHAVKLKSIVRTPDGTEEWIYSETFATKNKSGEVEFKDIVAHVRNPIRIKDNEPEKAFFYLKKLAEVQTGELVVENPEEKAINTLGKERELNSVKFYILNDDSPLDISDLRLIAQSWGYPDANIMTEAQLRVGFLQFIENEQTKTGTAFKRIVGEIKGIDNNELVKLKADIQTAIDNGKLGYSNYQFEWPDGEGDKKRLTIVPANEEENKVDYLAKLLLKKPSDLELFYDRTKKRIGRPSK